jgi:hypothetical protein
VAELWSQDAGEEGLIMELLKEVMELRGIGYPMKATLIQRTDKKAMYLRDDEYYEIFKVYITPAGEMFGKFYPEREAYPCNEDFGVSAWCFHDRQKAYRRYEKL